MRGPWRSPYSVHTLRGIGGYFLFVSLNGEALGLYFGETEAAVAAEASLAIADSMGVPAPS